jgi:ligand-binding sensor domain-containing protein/two-component sensor histidine kinase
VQTQDGYLWFGTPIGLIRFDGMRATVFNNKNVDSFKENVVSSLLETNDGTLWIGTGGGGIIKFKDNQFTHYGKNEGLSHDYIGPMWETKDGSLWIGTGGGGLNRFKDGKFTNYVLPENHVRSLYEDREGNIWIGTRAGLIKFRDGNFISYTTKDGLSDNLILSIYEDREGALWIGTSNGLSYLKDNRFIDYSKRDGFSDDSIQAIYQDRDGSLWIGTSNSGIARIEKDHLSFFSTKDSLSDDNVLAIYEDREGSLWIGTRDGLNCLKDGKFLTLTKREGLSSDHITSVLETRDGSVWLGTEDKGLIRVKNRTISTVTVKDGLPSNQIGAIYESRDGKLWIGSPEALISISNGKRSTYRDKEYPQSVSVTAINEDAESIIVGLSGPLGVPARLCRLKDNDLVPYSISSMPQIRFIYSIHIGQNGSMWLGTTDGLVRCEDGKCIVYTTKDGMAEENVTSIHESDGTIWTTSRRGITRLANEKFTVYNTDIGLFDNTVWQILEDEKSSLWVSSSRGIFRLNKKELNEYAEGQRNFINSLAFGKADGMKNIECSGGSQPNGWRTRNGELWFPTKKGVVIVEPSKIRLNEIPPPVVIEKVIVDNESVPENIRLQPGKGRFEIQYTALSLLAPERVKFRYKLEGFDKDWIDGGNARVAYYTNIPPGDYTFKVIACNNDGIWNQTGDSFSFHLKPYFYQTYWVYILTLSAIALLSWSLYRQRVRQMRAQFSAVMEERNRIAREIHDSMTQGFVGILAQLTAVKSMVAGAPKEVQLHLDIAANMVRHSLAEARRSVRNLRAKALEETDLSSTLSEIAKQLLVNTNVEVTVQGTPTRLSNLAENHLLRIGQEALTNIAKYADAKNVYIDLIYKEKEVTLRVIDDGRGFDTNLQYSAQTGQFGLLGMHERAKQIGGTISIKSELNKGTEIEVTVPID